MNSRPAKKHLQEHQRANIINIKHIISNTKISINISYKEQILLQRSIRYISSHATSNVALILLQKYFQLGIFPLKMRHSSPLFRCRGKIVEAPRMQAEENCAVLNSLRQRPLVLEMIFCREQFINKARDEKSVSFLCAQGIIGSGDERVDIVYIMCLYV